MKQLFNEHSYGTGTEDGGNAVSAPSLFIGIDNAPTLHLKCFRRTRNIPNKKTPIVNFSVNYGTIELLFTTEKLQYYEKNYGYYGKNYGTLKKMNVL